jgi:hypothetical protein
MNKNSFKVLFFRKYILDRLRNFNYFSKSSATTNEQIIATRVFCLLLLVSSVILITYYGTERVVTIYQIESPIFEQFIDLQSDQQSNPSFSCPCSTITSMYENIIDVTYTLHPTLFFGFCLQTQHNYFFYDFRTLGSIFFYSLASLGEVSIEYIHVVNASLFVTQSRAHFKHDTKQWACERFYDKLRFYVSW